MQQADGPGLAIVHADPGASPLGGSIADHLCRRATQMPEGTALIWEDDGAIRRMNFAQLLQSAENAARGLLRHAQPGDRVAVWARNSLDWVIAEYACALAGIVLAPWNTSWTDPEVSHALSLTSPRIILADVDVRGVNLLERARALGAEAHVAALSGIGDDSHDPTAPLPEVSADTPFLIQFTSGTTGRAKGALHTQGSAVNGGYLRSDMSEIEPGEVLLNVSPLHHVSGSVSLVIGAMVAGAAYALMPRFDAGAYLRMTRESGATRIGGVPTMLVGLLEHPDFPAGGFPLKGIGVGGAEVPEALVRRLQGIFGCAVLNGYGQSECPLIANSLPGDTPDLIATTVGKPAPQNDLKIVNPADGQLCRIGEAGEICVRSPAVMQGYWDNPAATAEVIDTEGWLRTGDLGVLLASGHLRVKGRVRDVIIRGGENIYPLEVESALCEHPSVAQAAVVGIVDPKWGQQVGAAVRLKDGAGARPAELEEFLAQRVSHFKVPRRWLFVDALPMTASGKVMKFELEARFVEGVDLS